MKQMKKLHCGLKELVNFIQVDSRAKHGVKNITFQSSTINYWMRKLKTLDEQS